MKDKILAEVNKKKQFIKDGYQGNPVISISVLEKILDEIFQPEPKGYNDPFPGPANGW